MISLLALLDLLASLFPGNACVVDPTLQEALQDFHLQGQLLKKS